MPPTIANQNKTLVVVMLAIKACATLIRRSYTTKQLLKILPALPIAFYFVSVLTDATISNRHPNINCE